MEKREAPIAVVHDERTDCTLSVWLTPAVLASEFKRQRPRVGEKIAIKRLPDSDRNYKRFRLLVDRPEAASEPNWDALGSGEGMESARAQGDLVFGAAEKEAPAQDKQGKDEDTGEEIPF